MRLIYSKHRSQRENKNFAIITKVAKLHPSVPGIGLDLFMAFRRKGENYTYTCDMYKKESKKIGQ